MGIHEIFAALSDPVRRDILKLLKKEKLSAGDISARLGLSPAALSYHLKKLKEAGLLYESRYKNFIYYELDATILDEIILWFSDLKEE
ncbi:Helix-turn-helix domain-containing protein [Anaerocolumna jejuensis DSM 15929]|uniref:Helix-turn-helix domain-containing protein n=1 Tax=Anaerocolumna jejuensis DSM 15929 TaxID=1121322 RepID=A0A1M6K6T8_9FIRM|nr:metalloregulator ArsR/SmtB family transcription factor [Anaerocolumna jejuensis]SHJ54689.1 Helix-turn-helix domain-containing protein [Anaerocolumna jejuensis DSM 15929]